MDQEMMNQVNEVLKVSGKRELSDGELDQVVGGVICDYHDIKTDEDLQSYCFEFLWNLEQTFGKGTVEIFLMKQLPSQILLDEYHNFGCNGVYNFLGRLFFVKGGNGF